MAQCYHRQSCISVYWVIPNPRPWHGYFHVHLQLRECGVWLSSNIFCTAINNKLNLAMHSGKIPIGGRRQRGWSKFVCWVLYLLILGSNRRKSEKVISEDNFQKFWRKVVLFWKDFIVFPIFLCRCVFIFWISKARQMNFKVAKPNFVITCFSKKNICVVCKMLRAVC